MINSRSARLFSSVTDITGALFLPVFLVLPLLLVSGLVLAGNSGTDSRLEALTHSLAALNKAYQHAAPTARAKALDDLRSIATERHALLASLIVDDPGAALRVAVPSRVRTGMPEDVRAFIEQRPELEGELEVLYEDYEDGSARLRHFLKVSDKRISLHFKNTPPGLLSGTPVHASGVLLDGVMALESGENFLTLAAPGGGNGGGGGDTPAPVLNTLGEQKTLLILVNFQDDPTEPYTVGYAQNVIFGTTNDFYLENSQQQTWLSGDVAGWFTIASNSTVCDIYAIADQAQSAATSAGVNVSTYDHLVYAFPLNSACGWWGLSSVGGNPSQAWVSGEFELGVTAHELGHGMGLFHSHAKECGSTTLGDNCTTYEYNDFFDMMGTSHFAHFNAFQKERLGWLNEGESSPITTVLTDGSYVIDSYASNGSGPKALKILKSSDSTTGNKTWYYVQSRQAVGFDALDRDIANNPNILNGLLIHSGTESNGNSSYLLDMTPESGSSIYWDWLDPALIVGQHFGDQDAGVTITPASIGQTSATVNITFGQPQCVRGTPAISVSPAQGQWVVPGTPVSYGVTVTSTDSAACSIAGFDLSAIAPADWNVDISSSFLLITPGASDSVNMIVTSPQTAAEGFHDITITASESDAPSFSASATATYVIEPADPTPTCSVQPPLLGVSPGSQNANPGTTLFYTVSLTNEDNAVCSASNFDLTLTSLPGDWSGDFFPTSISLSPGTTGTTTFSITSPGSATAGSYNLQIAASDALDPAHERTTTATYVVNDTSQVDDTHAPSTPTGLVAGEMPKQVNLSWNASSDNKGVAGYQVWRDGVVIADTTDTAYTDRDLANNVQYEYNVDAYDAAYNVSGMSDPIVAGKAKGKGAGGGKGKNK